MMYQWSILTMTRNELIALVERLESKGGFAQALGQALLRADDNNLKRLFNAFPELETERKQLTKHLSLISSQHH